MITDNTCKGCGKEKCDARKRGGEMHDQCPEYPWACCGHPEEKKPQPKVCEDKCYCEGTFHCAKCGCDNQCSCPPLPPKDGKGEEGWEERFDSKRNELWCADALTEEPVYFGYRRIVKVGNDTEVVTITDWGHIKAFIRQVAAKAREDDYSKAIEDAKEAVKLYCPKQQNHSAFEKGFDSCKRTVLLALDKLKKKYEMGM